jgi:hypothetical protein
MALAEPFQMVLEGKQKLDIGNFSSFFLALIEKI